MVIGIVTMVSDKHSGRHPTCGTIYWCLAARFVSATALSVMRWAEDYPLFILCALSYLSATSGRAAHRRQWHDWLTIHISGMGTSYILLLIAFYVDNGRSLPFWRNLPTLVYGLVPSAVVLPLIGWALTRHPLVRQTRCTPRSPNTHSA